MYYCGMKCMFDPQQMMCVKKSLSVFFGFPRADDTRHVPVSFWYSPPIFDLFLNHLFLGNSIVGFLQFLPFVMNCGFDLDTQKMRVRSL